MSQLDLKRPCDFCYNPNIMWAAEIKCGSQFAWHFQICDSCRLVLRNVISVVLHKMTHSQLVSAITDRMDDLGISYDDLMRANMFEQMQLETGKVEDDDSAGRHFHATEIHSGAT